MNLSSLGSPLTPSLSPSEGERVPFRAGEGPRCAMRELAGWGRSYRAEDAEEEVAGSSCLGRFGCFPNHLTNLGLRLT